MTAAGAVPAEGSPYWRFYEQVAAAQVRAWQPVAPSRVLDLSGGRTVFAGQLLAGGHEVVHVHATAPVGPVPPAGAGDAGGTGGVAPGSGPAGDGPPEGGDRWRPVVADPRSLGWLADASVDAVLAESRALSRCLATEVTAQELARVLRPGGRLLLVVDALVTGLARLADQGRWAELADVPAADCVLVPDEHGSISRCFWPEELSALLAQTGLAVDWVRPRTVLTPAAVERAVEQGGEPALRSLVRTELALARDRQGDAGAMHLVVSARRPG